MKKKLKKKSSPIKKKAIKKNPTQLRNESRCIKFVTFIYVHLKTMKKASYMEICI